MVPYRSYFIPRAAGNIEQHFCGVCHALNAGIIWSMEAEVSLTLEDCICVLFTMFCTLILISCMVLVTSSMAEDERTLTLAESSEASAT